jgi:hypothetical protein
LKNLIATIKDKDKNVLNELEPFERQKSLNLEIFLDTGIDFENYTALKKEIFFLRRYLALFRTWWQYKIVRPWGFLITQSITRKKGEKADS